MNELENIIEELEKERDWRVGEFRRIKNIYLHIKEDERYNTTYSTMCIPIIYAHWEGFCVTSFRIVINYINNQQLSYEKIINSLFTYSHSTTYDYLKGKQGFQQRCKFSTRFLSSISTAPIEIGQKIDTKSNLKFKILVELLSIFSVPSTNFSKYERDLNKLVEVRNHIAHGENSIVVDESMIQDFTDTTISLIDEIILMFSDYLTNKKYLK